MVTYRRTQAFKLLFRMFLVAVYHCRLMARCAARAARRNMPCDRYRRYRNQIKRRHEWEAKRSLSQVRAELEARGICTKLARQSRSQSQGPASAGPASRQAVPKLAVRG